MKKMMVMDNPFGNLEERNAYILKKIGVELRMKIVSPRIYSMATDWLYLGEKPIMNDPTCANNWTDFWCVDKTTGKFLHEDMVYDWLVFMFGSEQKIRAMFHLRGLHDDVYIRKVIDWRNQLLVHGGRKTDFIHRVGILFLETAAHQACFNLLKKCCPNVTATIVDGKVGLTNRNCKEAVKDALRVWHHDNNDILKTKDTDTKFLILMDGMGNRSFSIGEITFAVFTGNDPSAASFEQKIGRVRTEFGKKKEAFVIDCSLSKDYSFNVEKLIKVEADKANTTVEKMLEERDKYHMFDNIFKYVFEIGKTSGDFSQCSQLFNNVDYNSILAHHSLVSRVDAFVAHLRQNNSLCNLVVDDDVTFINTKGCPEEVKNAIKGTDKTTTKKPKPGKNKAEEEETTLVYTKQEKLIRQMYVELWNCDGFCMSYPTEGEDEQYPMLARWEENKEMWISAFSKEYGKDCRKYWDWFVGKVMRDGAFNIHLAELGKKHQIVK